MSKVLRVLFYSAVLFVASLSGCLLQAQPRDEQRVLRASYGNFYPYSFTDNSGLPQGYQIDLMRQMASAAGYEIEFIEAENPKRFLEMLARGDVDMTPLLALTGERKAAGLATTPLGQYEMSVYVRRDSPVDRIEGLSGLRVGVLAGSSNQAAAEQISFAKVVVYQTADALLLPLLNGEVDAVVGVVETFEAQLRQNFIKDKVRRLKPSLVIIPYGLIVRRDLPDVHSALEAVIATKINQQSLEVLKRRWFGQDPSIMAHPWFEKVATILAGGTLTVLALGIYVIRLRQRSVTLAAENSAKLLVIDAFDEMRAAIVVFDKDMKAVQWNSGFNMQFPKLVPVLQNGVTMEELWVHAYEKNVVALKIPPEEVPAYAAKTARMVKRGETVQRLIHTKQGRVFDQSLFRSGADHYAAIWVDVSERQRQQERIEAQADELARKNEQLVRFSAIAAHDLKAPLMQQSALVDFILEDMADANLALPPEVQSHFSMLTDLSRRMNLLVCDLLEYAKADMKHARSTCFLPNARLEEVVELAALKLGIRVLIEPDMPAVQVAPTAFDMVMRNLITNAAKHHDKTTGRIIIRAKRLNHTVVIDVEDDGPGIAVDDRIRVFEPFQRLTRVEGTGLGLAFIKKTVLAWGGDVTISAAPLRGSVFSISLPAAPDNVIALGSASYGPAGKVKRGA